MAGERYLISCQCGREVAVRSAAAGTIRECPQCGAELPLPSYRQLRQCPIAAELVVRARPFQFSLKSLFVVTLALGVYLAAANHWGCRRVTILSLTGSIYAAIQGLLSFRGTRLVVYLNVLAFVALVSLLPMPVWLFGQQVQARRTQVVQKLRSVGQRYAEQVMFHGEPRDGAQTVDRLQKEMFPEGI